MRPTPDLIEPVAVPLDVRAKFRGYSWCDDIFSSPSTQPIATNYDLVAPGITSSFMRKSLTHHDAIVSWQSFHKARSTPASGDASASASTSTSASASPEDGELWVLYSVGPGADGQHTIAHGGFITTLLDQAMGSWLKLHSGIGVPMTIYLNMTFKSALRTPSAALVRAWIASIDGRKIKMNACLEREGGQLIATAEALFISGAKL